MTVVARPKSARAESGPEGSRYSWCGRYSCDKKSTCVTSGTHGYSKHMKVLAHKSLYIPNPMTLLLGDGGSTSWEWGGGVALKLHTSIKGWFSVQCQWQCGQSWSNNRHRKKSQIEIMYIIFKFKFGFCASIVVNARTEYHAHSP